MLATKWFNLLYYFCNRIMKQELFSSVLARCLANVALNNGHKFEDGAAQAWGHVGAAFLGYVLCGLPVTELRAVQYRTRDQYGPVILDCRWYDLIKDTCLNYKECVQALLPGPDDSICKCDVNKEVFLEMLDFCREG